MPRDDKAPSHGTPTTSLTLDMADFLLSTSTAPILLQLQRQTLSPEYTLQILTELRKEFTPNQAAALLRLAQLRQKAKRKFPAAERMFFTAESLEQATAWDVALHRAQAIHCVCALLRPMPRHWLLPSRSTSAATIGQPK